MNKNENTKLIEAGICWQENKNYQKSNHSYTPIIFKIILIILFNKAINLVDMLIIK